MRTTVRLDRALLREAKRVALETDRTLTSLIEDALRQLLSRRRGKSAVRRVTLPTFKGDGVREGVDLNRTAELYELMDRDGPR